VSAPVPPARKRVNYIVNLQIRWQDLDGNEGVAREIARDMRGTLGREFAVFLRERKASVLVEVATNIPITFGKD